jgi:hypothetical protein
MNRKNLTAAVLAGLAGAAGLAGTAQAVNLNPDGLGQVLIYPYYTANGGNNTLLSVVNTTDNAKAVKVRFLEGFNSREVLDFNLYLSHHDVWVAAIVNVAGDNPSPDYNPTGYETDTYLFITDDSCTVPYLYEDYQVFNEITQSLMGVQPFLDYAYTGSNNDGGPDVEQRAAEGHFEMIEMGTITPGSDTEDDITHQWHTVKDGDDYWAPGDCDQLVENWTQGGTGEDDGIWFEEAQGNDGQAWTDTLRNSGGLFGGAAVVHPANGAMWSYDAKAVQGFDTTDDGIHYVPGTIYPSLNSGSETDAWVFFGVPQNQAVELQYQFSVDAVSAVFMHEFTMNEYTTADVPGLAATEWIVTFPTKNFYVDQDTFGDIEMFAWQPKVDTEEEYEDCNYWEEGLPYPTTVPGTGLPIMSPGPFDNDGWENCEYEEVSFYDTPNDARRPFTELYDGGACEEVALVIYDRDERTFSEKTPGNPPVVSPAPPRDDPDDVIFELCNEVNVLRFNEREVFYTPDLGEGDHDSLLVSVLNPAEFEDGWGWIDYYYDDDHVDYAGLVGLPVAGFAVTKFDNNFVMNADGDFVKAFYGGLYWHKGNVRKVRLARGDRGRNNQEVKDVSSGQ